MRRWRLCCRRERDSAVEVAKTRSRAVTSRFPGRDAAAAAVLNITSCSVIRTSVEDVSADGMFVRPVNSLTLDAHLTFSAVLDDNQPPVSGHARVVRNITEADARSSGLQSGYGLVILEMADPERDREEPLDRAEDDDGGRDPQDQVVRHIPGRLRHP